MVIDQSGSSVEGEDCSADLLMASAAGLPSSNNNGKTYVRVPPVDGGFPSHGVSASGKFHTFHPRRSEGGSCISK